MLTFCTQGGGLAVSDHGIANLSSCDISGNLVGSDNMGSPFVVPIETNGFFVRARLLVMFQGPAFGTSVSPASVISETFVSPASDISAVAALAFYALRLAVAASPSPGKRL